MKTKNYFYFILITFFLSIFLEMYSINSILIGVFAVLSISYMLKHKIKIHLSTHQKAYIGICLFYILMFLIDYIFISKFGKRSFLLLNRSFLIIPIILIAFFLNHIIANKNYTNFFNVYILLSFIPIFVFFFKNKNDFSINSITNNLIIHRPYLGFMLGVSIIMLIYKLMDERAIYKKFILSSLIMILLFFCFLIHVKMTIISLFFSIVLTIVIFWKSKSKPYIVGSVILSALILTIYLSIYKSQELNKVANSFIYGKNIEFKEGSLLKGEENSFNLRIITWKYGLNEIKNNIWFGVGSDKAQILLDKHYSTLGFPWMINMNTHNQYMDNWLTKGIAGFISLLTLCLYPIYVSFKTKDVFLFSFNMLFIFCCLTENMLSRQLGIVSYIFINSYIIFSVKRLDDKTY